MPESSEDDTVTYDEDGEPVQDATVLPTPWAWPDFTQLLDFSLFRFGGAPVTSTLPWSPDSRAAQLPQWEQDIIISTARSVGVDPAALASIRIIENGSAGREFGVLSVPAPTYQDQARVAAQTIKNNLARYTRDTGENPLATDGQHYTDAYLRYLSNVYAPIGARNDPRGLNAFHAENFVAVYHGAIA